MQQFKELEAHRQYTSPTELHRTINTLRGLVAGMTTDRCANKVEVDNWKIGA